MTIKASKTTFIFSTSLSVLLATTACSAGATAEGDSFPDGRIDMIVPWAAGGGTDQTARQLAAVAEDTCGTNIVVSNQTGSSGAVGFQASATSEADGYTVGLVTSELSIINHLGVAEVTPEDLTGVMQFAFDVGVITVPADSPYSTIGELIEAAEAGGITVSSSGTGSIWHLGTLGMAQEAGVELTNVPFDGSAPAITATLGGQTDANSAGVGEVLPQIESGALRPLAVMGEERVEFLPDTPTLIEEGIEWNNGVWRGLTVPNGTADDKVEKLNACFQEAYESEDFQSFMETQGFGAEYKPAGDFEAYMDEEFATFSDIIANAGLAP